MGRPRARRGGSSGGRKRVSLRNVEQESQHRADADETQAVDIEMSHDGESQQNESMQTADQENEVPGSRSTSPALSPPPRKRYAASFRSVEELQSFQPGENTTQTNNVEMSDDHDETQRNETVGPTATSDQVPRTPSPNPSVPRQRRLTDTPGPRADGSYEYFERGINDESNPLDEYNDSSSIQREMERQILDNLMRSGRVSLPGLAMPIQSTSPEVASISQQFLPGPTLPTQSTLNDMEEGAGNHPEQPPVHGYVGAESTTLTQAFDHLNNTEEDQIMDALGELERLSSEMNGGSEHEDHQYPSTSHVEVVGEDVYGREELGESEQSSSGGSASTISSASERPPPSPALSFDSVSSSVFLPSGRNLEEGEINEQLEVDTEEHGPPPPHESSQQPSAEEFESSRIRAACLKMFENEWEGAKDKYLPITPIQWTKFRQEIFSNRGFLQFEGQPLLRGEDTDGGIILYRVSTSKPVCSLPCCFSTDGTTPQANTRCTKHRGSTISYAVIELVFNEKVLGRNTAVGLEHVLLMFSHYHSDSIEQQARRALDEYINGGHLEDTARRLRAKKLKRCAKELLISRTASVNRQWISHSGIDASMQFYKIALAAGTVYDGLGRGLEVVPHGVFKGQHLELITGSFIMELGLSKEAERKLYRDVDVEQFETFGYCRPHGRFLTIL